jgi:type I restriction enzyme S subunit
MVRPLDILVSTANSFELVGKVSLVKQMPCPSTLGAFISVVRASSDLDAQFLYFQMSSFEVREAMRRSASTTTNISNISTASLKELDLRIAPLPEQHRIVAAIEEQFSRLDAAVASLERARAGLKRYRAAVLAAACSGRLVSSEVDHLPPYDLYGKTSTPIRLVAEAETIYDSAPSQLSLAGIDPRSSANTRANFAALPSTDLPAGWSWVRVDQVGSVQLGRQRSPQHHSGPHMRPYLRVANVYEDRIDLSNVLEMNFTPAEFSIYHLEEGDILLNEGQSLEWVGRPAMYRGGMDNLCFQNTLVRFRAFRNVDPRYALIVFRAYLHNGTFRRIARWTVNIAHLGAARVAELAFPLPPLPEQHSIVAEVERRLSVVDELEAAVAADLKRAERLRQAILRRAFAGKLVPQDPNDEPTSVLLERIHVNRDDGSTRSRAGKAHPQTAKL